MRLVRALLLGFVCVGLGACGAGIADINARPDKYYQHKVDVAGRIVRRQDLPAETLLEVADAHGARILVKTATPPEAHAGDWVRVRGILVPEARVGDAMVYDVVVADRVTRTRPPRFAGLM